MSIRRACAVLELDTPTYQYKSCRPDQADLKTRIKEIVQTRMRYGYRRVHVMRDREGWGVNIKLTFVSIASWACNYATKRRSGA